MFCGKCGTELGNDVKFCFKCGANQSEQLIATAVNNSKNDKSADTPSSSYALLGFLIPIVGLILYIVWKDDNPKRANSAGKGALIGFILGMITWAAYCYSVLSTFSGFLRL